MEIPSTEIISQRDLEFVSETGKESVKVYLEKPAKDNDGVWFCPYSINSKSFSKRFHAYGEDSMQALILALKTIPIELDAIAKKRGGRFTWFDQKDIDFPFIVE